MRPSINPEASIRRIYTEQAMAVGQTIELDQAGAKHLITVCRHRAGAPVVLFNGDGLAYTGTLLAPASVKACRIAIETAETPKVESSIDITLVQAIGRGERMDWAIQKAVELGVTGIVPLVSERVTVKLDAKRSQQRLKRWQAIVIAACEQSGRVKIPWVEAPVTLNAWAPPEGQMLCYLDPKGTERLKDLSKPQALTLCVGPEGGWTEAEINFLKGLGGHGIGLGGRVMRTETAGLACVAGIHALWGDFTDGQ